MKKIFNFAIPVLFIIGIAVCVIFPAETHAAASSGTGISSAPMWSDFNDDKIYDDNIEVVDYGGIDNSGISGDYFTTAKSAGRVLRKDMVDRKKTVVIEYKMLSSELSDNNWFSALCDDIMYNAFLHTGNPKEGDSLKYCLKSYHAKASYIKTTTNCYITITFTLAYYTTANQEQKLDKKIKDVKKELKLDGKSDYQKVKIIYEYICKNVKYSSSGGDLKYTAYNALVNKKAVCQGYAVLFYRLALESDVDVRVITGYGNSERHAWNIVELENYYYNLDSTWDAGQKNFKYFLKGSKYFSGHSSNNYFKTKSFKKAFPLKTTNYKKHTHKWNKNYTIDKKATYSSAGSKSIHCSTCNAKKSGSTVKIPKKICKLKAPSKITTTLTQYYGAGNGYDDLKILWPKVSGAKGYYVKYKKAGTDKWYGKYTTKTYTYLKDLSDGKKYNIRVYPYVTEKGVKYKSINYKKATSVYTLKKTNITEFTYGENSIDLNWEGIHGVTGYQVYKSSEKDGEYTNIKSIITNSTEQITLSININPTSSGWYKIRPYKCVGENKYVYGPWSDKINCPDTESTLVL